MGFLDDYEPVEVRLEKFWAENKNGRVITDLVSYSTGEYIVRAEVWRDALEERPTASGYAQELVTAKGVNSTSALENCETSAIGRALANLGYAAKGKRPSREEMAKSHREPEPGPAITSAQRRRMHALFNANGLTDRTERLAFTAGLIGRELASSNDLTKDEATRLIDHLQNLAGDQP